MTRFWEVLLFVSAFAQVSRSIAAQPSPIGPLPADRSANGLWTITGSINGVEANFLIDTGMDHTSMLPGLFPAGEKLAEIRIGSLKMSMNVDVSEVPSLRLDQALAPRDANGQPRPFAVLGLDVLAGMQVGFDFAATEVTIWADGKLTSQHADEWVTKGAEANARATVPMEMVRGKWFGMQIRIGQHHALAIVDTGANGGVLLSKLIPSSEVVQVGRVQANVATPMGITVYDLAPGVSFGGVTVPWWSFLSVDRIEMQVGEIDGVFGLEGFRSERVLLDLQNPAVHFRKMAASYGFQRILFELLKVPVIITEDKIVLGAVKGEGLAQYSGKTVVSIAGVNSGEIRACLYHPAAESSATMAKLAKAGIAPNTSCDVVVEGDKGPVTITFGDTKGK